MINDSRRVGSRLAVICCAAALLEFVVAPLGCGRATIRSRTPAGDVTAPEPPPATAPAPFVLRLTDVKLHPERDEVQIEVEVESNLSEDKVFCDLVFRETLFNELVLVSAGDDRRSFRLERNERIRIDGSGEWTVRARSREQLTVKRRLMSDVGVPYFTFVREDRASDGTVTRLEDQWPSTGTYQATVSAELFPLRPGRSFSLKSELLVEVPPASSGALPDERLRGTR